MWDWTVKKAERRRIDAFELWCWTRLLRVPWTARRSNQSVLKEISPGISLEGLMLKLKLQYFGHLTRKVDSLENPDAGRDWGQEEMGTTEDEMAGWHHRLDGRESEWTLGVGDGPGGLVLWFMGSQRVGHDWAAELNWTDALSSCFNSCFNLLSSLLWLPPTDQRTSLEFHYICTHIYYRNHHITVYL